jgi:hypothetical protein
VPLRSIIIIIIIILLSAGETSQLVLQLVRIARTLSTCHDYESSDHQPSPARRQHVSVRLRFC